MTFITHGLKCVLRIFWQTWLDILRNKKNSTLCKRVPCNTLTHSTNEDLLNIKRKGDPEVSLFPLHFLNAHVCEVSNLLFTSSTSKGNFTYLYLTDLNKLLQSVLQTPYTATPVKNLIELDVITRNPKTLFKDILPRKFWQFTFLHILARCLPVDIVYIWPEVYNMEEGELSKFSRENVFE
jgi:hypothetical protein